MVKFSQWEVVLTKNVKSGVFSASAIEIVKKVGFWGSEIRLRKSDYTTPGTVNYYLAAPAGHLQGQRAEARRLGL